ncbi:cytochrome d ubiquinol oxidase subunit II [Vallicoccus soli]|uniref:Cytochrome d ubiquinol oxidase subunit II n=1 Tax=Vallicoccus soli TaxID=2339232 RepID=A0A3A3Z2G0_9ACTN|nr:cytochrome d ubiquinol oxidase subunit II [Vallicoccus soli]RJK97624.1 cytochrome d ubiquinol oxidase subunit II [Vallicoccus soli]
MTLPELWFVLIAVLWAGYFVLEGFDFGVGMLLAGLSRDEVDRRVVLNTIGPVWDGNEVWVLVAGGATFAAFPDWYASLFSGFYLPLLLVLVALIVRGVAFEYRGKVDSASWRRRWDLCIVWGSLLPSVLWGVAFANLVRGVPMTAEGEFDGSLLGLLNPYALLGGLTTCTLFLLHGALFLALRTTGGVRERAHRAAAALGPVAAALAVAFLGWTQALRGSAATLALAAVAAAALVAGLVAQRARREGWAFALTAVTLVAAVATLFVALFPDVMPSSTDPAGTLSIAGAASSGYTLEVMTRVAAFGTPLVLLYQGWTYWVFRRRIGRGSIPAPVALPAQRRPETAPEQVG